jgi:hypothetical protein
MDEDPRPQRGSRPLGMDGQLDEAAPRGRTVHEPPMSYRAPCAFCIFALAFVCSFSLSDAVKYLSV